MARRSMAWAAAAALSLLVSGSGCLQPARRALPADEEERFRATALEVLKKAAFSEEPAIRMHAIEALQEVAPREGLECISANIENGYGGVSFAALMALGTMRRGEFIEQIRIRAEDADPNVVIAALFALHRLGDQKRTGELSEYLLNNRDFHIRANAALVLGRLEEPSMVKLLRIALQQEKKISPKLQILEALAMYENRNAIERLMAYSYDPRPDVATTALNFLANANSEKAEDVFLYRLRSADFPEIKLEAARGLGRLGRDDGMDLALAHLRFNAPDKNRPNDAPQQQVARIRGLAALALEAIGSPQALGPLKDALSAPEQPEDVRLAVARAAVRIIDQRGGRSPRRPADAEKRK
ncbi:MAG TPA: HEAT repeat domain-containing protein [Phycisphaerae bacterium]|nr:HEAT repeat domain-containing protein [Phycisphaerae bacterium]